MTTAVQERAFPGSGDAGLTELKEYLDMDPLDASDDVILGLALSAAKEAADAYLNNPFTTTDDGGTPDDESDDTVVEDPIPAMVELGVLIWAAKEAERIDPSITRKKAGGIEEQYSGGTASEDAIRSRYWDGHRLLPGT